MDTMSLQDILDDIDILLEHMSADEIMMSVLFAVREIVEGKQEVKPHVIAALQQLKDKDLPIARESNSGKTSLPIILLKAKQYSMLVDCIMLFDFSLLATNPRSETYQRLFSHLSSLNNSPPALLEEILNRLANDTAFTELFNTHETLQLLVAISLVSTIHIPQKNAVPMHHKMNALGQELRTRQQRADKLIPYIITHPVLIDRMCTVILNFQHKSYTELDITPTLRALITTIHPRLPAQFILRHTRIPALADAIIAYEDINVMDAIAVVTAPVKTRLLKSLG